MTSLKELAAAGRDLSVKPSSRLGRLFRQEGVQRTPDFDRIKHLPRRDPRLDDRELAEQLTAYLKTPNGTMNIWPFQAAALREVHDYGGCFINARVGIGKTLVSFLTPVLIGSTRPVLLIPARLREKTLRDFAKLGQHFVSVPIRIISYEELGRKKGQTLLEEAAPDLIVADEGHRLSRTESAVTKRVSRWIQEHRTRFVVMSGTITSRALADFGHLMYWSIPNHTPLPTNWQTLTEWGRCVDEERVFGTEALAPGVLVELMNDEERRMADQIAAARRAVHRRMSDTPGVILTTDRFEDASLVIDAWLPRYSNDIEARFHELRSTWELDDQPIEEATQIWAYAYQLAMGFYKKWVEEPPEAWLFARREWSSALRHIVKTNRSSLDSPEMVEEAVMQGLYDGKWVMKGGVRQHSATIDVLYHRWQAVKPSFEPRRRAVWVDTAVLEQAAAWLSDSRGLVWVKHIAVGRKLHELTGAPYFHEEGFDSTGRYIEDWHGPAIASIYANMDGRNLQQWSTQLILSPPTKGSHFEQLLGRTHRVGQKADTVECLITFGCQEHLDAWEQSLRDAQYTQDTVGQEQKILYADVLFEKQQVTGKGPRWA